MARKFKLKISMGQIDQKLKCYFCKNIFLLKIFIIYTRNKKESFFTVKKTSTEVIKLSRSYRIRYEKLKKKYRHKQKKFQEIFKFLR